MQVIEVFDRGVLRAAQSVCLENVDDGRTWTYEEAHDFTHRVAGSLLSMGLGRGSRLAVLSSNDPTAFLCHLGILRAGAAYVPLNVRSSDQDLRSLLELVKCDGLFYEGALEHRIGSVLPQSYELGSLISIGPGRTSDVELGSWICESGTRVELPEDDDEAAAWIIGTGGTTGLPKAVVLPQRALVMQALALVAHLPDTQPVQAVVAPLTHAAGALTFPVLMQGGKTLIHRGFQADALLDSIMNRGVNRLFLPPTAIYSLLAHPATRGCDFSGLKYFLYGAAPMSADKLREAMAVFGPVMAQFYGQAEAATICTFLTPEDHVEALQDPAKAQRLTSCGRPSYVAQVRILNAECVEVPRGEVGEICVRTPLRMLGYLDDPQRTAEIDRGNGWRGTGDLGRMDEQGYVFIVDRSRDLIITGGFNVFPSEVERVLWSNPSVKDCAVIGLPDPHWGEAVTAVVETVPGARIDETELIDFCRERLGSVKAPKQVIFRELPRSSVGKVLKRELRDEYWVGHERRV